MRKLCFLLVLFLLMAGCGSNSRPQQSHSHIDNDSNNLCDDCGRTLLVRFDIYAINDLHGKLADTDYQVGVDELSTYLKQAQQTGNTILLSTGDMWQGASESNLTEGRIVTEWMNSLGFSAMTMGGHEFDWGQQIIRENRSLAQFPFLGINIYNRETEEQVDYCQSSVVVEADGVQIGIIGAIGDCYHSISGEHTGDIYFKTGSQLTALVQAEAEKLRSEGADFIIYCIHDGSTQTTSDTAAAPADSKQLQVYYDGVLSDGSVDLVFEADTHYWYALTDAHGVYHLQAGANNQGISHATVLIDTTRENASFVTARLLPDSSYMHLEDDPIVAQLLEKYADLLAPASRVLGENGTYRNSFSLCRLVAELYCEKGLEKWGEQYDIVLGGGYLSCRSPGYLPVGQVSYSQLQALLPFDNEITLCSIQGRDLIRKFLETDNKNYHIKTTQYGQSIRKNVDPDETYYLVTDSYTATYAYNNLTILDTYSPDIFARDLLADYISAGALETS